MQTENEIAVFSIHENENLVKKEHFIVQLSDVSNEAAQNNNLGNNNYTELIVSSIHKNVFLCEAEHLNVQLPDVSHEDAQNINLENELAVSSIQQNDNLCEAKHSNIQSSDVGNEAAQNNKDLYPCNICQKVFIHPSGLNRHLRTHNNERNHACDLCNKTFKHLEHLSQHHRIHTGKYLHVCQFCEKGFISRKALSNHILRHTTPKYYACKFCKEMFSCKDDLLCHRTVHTEIFPYVCKHCKKGYSIVTQLKNHYCSHKKEFRFTCETCNKGFNFGASFRRHLITHTGERPYTCNICNKPCPSVAGLKLHSQLHIRRPHLCTICKSCFKNKNSLDKHLQLHSGVHPYACKYCNKTFTGNIMLLKHYSYHIKKSLDKQNKNNYVCSICSDTFDLKKNLLTHRRSHIHPDKKIFTCNVCSENFVYEKYFNSHAKTHGIDRPHVCGLCRTHFTSYNLLRRHLAKHADIDAIKKRLMNIPSITGPKISYAKALLCETNATKTSTNAKQNSSGQLCSLKSKILTSKNPVGSYKAIQLLKKNVNSSTHDLSRMPLSSVKICDQLDLQKMAIKPTNGVMYVLSSDSKVTNNKILLNKEIKIVGHPQMMNQNNLMTKKFLKPDQLVSVSNNNHQVFNQSVLQQRKCFKPASILTNVSIPASSPDLLTSNQQITNRISLLGKKIMKTDQLASVSNNNNQVFNQSVLLQSKCLKPAGILAPVDKISNIPVSPKSDSSNSADMFYPTDDNDSKVSNHPYGQQSLEFKHDKNISQEINLSSISKPDDAQPYARTIVPKGFDNLNVSADYLPKQTDKLKSASKVVQNISDILKKDSGSTDHNKLPSSSALNQNQDNEISQKSCVQSEEESFVNKTDSCDTDQTKSLPAAALNQNQDYDIAQKSCVQPEEEPFLSKIDFQDTCHTKPATAVALNQHQPYEIYQKSSTSTSLKLLEPLKISKNNNVCNIKSTLERTLVPCSNKYPFVCGMCKKGFFQLRYLAAHSKTHTNALAEAQTSSVKEPKTCNFCKKTFACLNSLSKHLIIHNTDNSLVRTTKARPANSHENFNIHLTAKNNKKYICKYCNKNFHHNLSLKTHNCRKSQKHELCKKSFVQFIQELKISEIASSKFNNLCKVCNKSFSSIPILERHSLVHIGKRRFTCNVCKKRFGQPYKLKVHKLMHTGQKTCCCHVCNKSSNLLFFLQRHYLSHLCQKVSS